MPALTNLRTGSAARYARSGSTRSLLGESVRLVAGQACFQDNAKYFADRRNPVVGHAIEQAMYFVLDSHDLSISRLHTVHRQWS